MTPADERILKLLDKWRVSLELHARYLVLNDDEYWLVQPWPKHERPTRWVVELARQRRDDLERLVKTRLAAADSSLSEALELMSFLTNLVGAQHVERFVPIAEPEQERRIASLQDACNVEETREMPAATEASVAAADAQSGAPGVQDSEVIRDAVRLLCWGREWHELPEAIARMAGRPDKPRVRSILKAHRSAIEQQAIEGSRAR